MRCPRFGGQDLCDGMTHGGRRALELSGIERQKPGTRYHHSARGPDLVPIRHAFLLSPFSPHGLWRIYLHSKGVFPLPLSANGPELRMVTDRTKELKE